MRRAILGGIFMLLLAAPRTAAAESPRWTDDRLADNPTIKVTDYDYMCSTGDAPTLLVGAAAVGLLLRRRRR